MIVTPAPHVEAYYIEQGRRWLAGEVELPARKLGGRRTRVHLSDLQNCPLTAYYKRVLPTLPALPDISVLRFLRGRGVEGILARELPPKEVDGIIGTVDDIYPDNDTVELGTLVEIKTTNETVDLFDIATSHTDWKERMMGYCHMYNRMALYLFIYFASGNLLSYMYWAKSGMEKKYGKDWRRKIKYLTTAARAYKLQFTDEELTANWEEHKIRAAILRECVKTETPMPIEVVRATRPQWQCKLCELAEFCYTKQGGKKDAKHNKSAGHNSSSSPYG